MKLEPHGIGCKSAHDSLVHFTASGSRRILPSVVSRTGHNLSRHWHQRSLQGPGRVRHGGSHCEVERLKHPGLARDRSAYFSDRINRFTSSLPRHSSAVRELTGLTLRLFRRECLSPFDWVPPGFLSPSAARLSLSKRVSRVATASAGPQSCSVSRPSTINAERPWTRDQHASETSLPSESPSKNFAASTAPRRALKQALPASSKTGCPDFFSIGGPNISLKRLGWSHAKRT